MPYYRKPIDKNPGFPPRSPSPPQFREYSLWGSSFTSSNFSTCTNMHAPAPQAPQRHHHPTRVADEGPRPYYHSADSHPKSPRIQRSDRLAWPPFMPNREEQRSMTLQSPVHYTRSPNQFTEEQPPRIRPKLWHKLSQHDQQRFSVSPQRPAEYCMSPFQSSMQFSEAPQPLMSMHKQRPRFVSPTGISDEYCGPPFQPSGQYGQDAHKFRMRTEPPQFPRSDEHHRSSFPAYNSFMRYNEDPQPLVPHYKDHYGGIRWPQQRPDTRSSILAGFYDEDCLQPLMPQKNIVIEEEPKPFLSGIEDQKTDNSPIEEEPKPVVTGIEDQESEVVIIERKSLYILPSNFEYGGEIDDPSPEAQEQAGTSSGTSGEWTSNIFKREGDPSSQSHNLTSRVHHQRQRTNRLNNRLVKVLSQPVKMEKGAKMMQRMGWIGGGLGKDGSGIVDPIAPNALYATSTVGFGQEKSTKQRPPPKRENRCVKPIKNKKTCKNAFKINVLLNLLKFATNDMQVEIYFDALLKNVERKRIHKIVEAINNKDSAMQFRDYISVVEDIRRRCRFTLSTQSNGEGEQRKICVFKEAPDHMFLVTPDDCRPCLTDIMVHEDEPNPFMKSIKKHLKEDPETASPAPTYLIDKLVEFFLEFCADEEYTEFRFLGPFYETEIVVINAFFALIEDLVKKSKPAYKVPLELLDVFDGNAEFQIMRDPNGFASITKSILAEGLQEEVPLTSS